MQGAVPHGPRDIRFEEHEEPKNNQSHVDTEIRNSAARLFNSSPSVRFDGIVLR